MTIPPVTNVVPYKLSESSHGTALPSYTHRKHDQPQVPVRTVSASITFCPNQRPTNGTPHQLRDSTRAIECANSATQLRCRCKLCNNDRKNGDEDARAEAVKQDKRYQNRGGSSDSPGAQAEEAAEDGHRVDGVGRTHGVRGKASPKLGVG